MYLQYFGLKEPPFKLTPDPRYVYLSKRHREGLAHLLYGLKEGGGFVQLTGEVGTGKTTLIRTVLERPGSNIEAALIFNPKLTALEFITAICDELRVAYPQETQSVKVLIDHLNTYLLEAYRARKHVVLIVDEAQNFELDVLEQIRLLTNLETSRHKLLQIILVGQPELQDMLDRPELRQLAQRITARYHLMPMTVAETKAYIEHRISVAGGRKNLFTDAAFRRIVALSGGVPRLINVLCDRALLGAYSEESAYITPAIIKKAATEVFGSPRKKRQHSKLHWAYGLAITAIIAIGITTYVYIPNTPTPHQIAQTTQPVPPVPAVEVAEAHKTNTATAIENITQQATEPVSPAPLPVAAVRQEQAPGPRVINSAMTFLQLAHANNKSRNLHLAFRSLFSAWDMDYEQLVGTTGCERAISAQLRCHWGNSDWLELVQLNRPTLIWLSGKNSREKHYIVITGIQDEVVTIELGDERHQVHADALKSLWNGRSLIFWRPPALDVDVIRPGDQGEIVLWLRLNLERLRQTKSSSAQAELYDEQLKAMVMDFQRFNELSADGLVGVKTFIHLNTLNKNANIPLLSAHHEMDNTP